MRVGIIGSGMMGKNHADALRRIPGVEVVTVADPYAQDLDDLAARFGVTKAYSDYKEMCQEMKLDVYITVPRIESILPSINMPLSRELVFIQKNRWQ